MDELETPPAARVLEVSVGTGANFPYLPADVSFFGLDISRGMLPQCRRRLKKWGRGAELFRGEAEHLPFRNGVFDVVFHVGGINFFNDKTCAVREMIRVAKPGTKLVIVDETEKLVKEQYQRTPFVRRYFQKRTETVAADPRLMIPPNMEDIRCREIFEGKGYCLRFRKP